MLPGMGSKMQPRKRRKGGEIEIGKRKARCGKWPREGEVEAWGMEG
jgi:hypothetical protein